jgi:signal recognition particle subunit SRP72
LGRSRLHIKWRSYEGKIYWSYVEYLIAQADVCSVLQLDPSSESAFQTLLFLNLQTDDYASALDLVLKTPSRNDNKLEFEKAYCLYRLHREKEALEILGSAGESRGKKEEHLEAQIVSYLSGYK